MGLGLRLSALAAEARRRIHGSRGGPASLGISASNRRLGGSRPRRGVSVFRRLTEVPPQWRAGVFSCVLGLKPAPPPGSRQRLDPPPTSQAPPPVRRDRRRAHSGGIETTLQTYCFNPIDSTRGTLTNSTAEKTFQTQSQLHAARPRQILILNFNYVYSQN